MTEFLQWVFQRAANLVRNESGPSSQQVQQVENEISSDGPRVDNWNLDLSMHRFLTFPPSFRQAHSWELLLILAEVGMYFKTENLYCNFCEFTISRQDFPKYLSLGSETARKEILKSQEKFNCTISIGDSTNVPLGSVFRTPNYEFEAFRLFSLVKKSDWQFVDPFALARSGFYFTGEEDKVRCVFCMLEVRGWEQGDTPHGEHLRWNPDCPFLRDSRSVVNVRIGEELVQGQIRENPFTEANGMEKYGPNLHFLNTSTLLFLDLSIRNWSAPVHSSFATLKSRMDSFREFWPPSLGQKTEEMARAGFFYTGSGDRAICFHCNLGLKDWYLGDDPFDQHTRWRPTCQFLPIVAKIRFQSCCRHVAAQLRMEFRPLAKFLVIFIILSVVYENVANAQRRKNKPFKGGRRYIVKCCGISKCIPKHRKVKPTALFVNTTAINKAFSGESLWKQETKSPESPQEAAETTNATFPAAAAEVPTQPEFSTPDAQATDGEFRPTEPNFEASATTKFGSVGSKTFEATQTTGSETFFSSLAISEKTVSAIKTTPSSIGTTPPLSGTVSTSGETRTSTLAPPTTTLVAKNHFLLQSCESSRCGKFKLPPIAMNKSIGVTVTVKDSNFVFVSTAMTQIEAAQNCLSSNLNLVSLQDISKLNLVQSVISSLKIDSIWTFGSNEGNDSCGADTFLQFAWCGKNTDLDVTIQQKISAKLAQKGLAFSANLSLTPISSVSKLPFLCEANDGSYKDSCSALKCAKNSSLMDANGILKDREKYGKWIEACGNNYLFSKFLGTWEQSVQFCCNFGLFPLNFGSASEFECFSGLSKANWTLNWNYWTAGRAMGGWGRWAWCIPGPHPLADGLAWASGQPDFANPQELCLHLQIDRNKSGSLLTDRNCSHKYVIACQGDAVANNQCKPKCPTTCKRNSTLFSNSIIKDLYVHGSWNSACGKEYLFSKQSLSWLDAWNYCCSVGMKLASVSDYDELRCLSKMVNRYPAAVYPHQINRDFWTSGSNLDCDGPHFWCSEDEKLRQDDFPGENWKGGRPPSQVAGNCIFINLSNASILGAELCSVEKQFLCEVLGNENKSMRIKETCKELWDVSDQEIDDQILNASALQAPNKRNLMCYIRCCGVRGEVIKYGQLMTEHIIRNLEDLTVDDPALMQSSFDGLDKCTSILLTFFCFGLKKKRSHVALHFFNGKILTFINSIDPLQSIGHDDECKLFSESYYCGKRTDPTLTTALLDANKGGSTAIPSPTGNINTKYRTCPDYGPCVSDVIFAFIYNLKK
ncbi:Hypothetical predicted protein [Cloeon dipterum]|uniref:C-type lectin domain-containing protein n=1 Tax=Cloeon dipterum TaxID=197152 RepID=A0A8S1D8K1_9INSE|nr:Hypothetical predicted protein [Cloeon dipterum]